MARVIDFEAFRPLLEEALAYSDGAKGGCPPYDPVAMFKVLILAARKDTDARWTVKVGRPRHKTVERSVPELAIPVFG